MDSTIDNDGQTPTETPKITTLVADSLSWFVKYIEEHCSEHQSFLFRGQRTDHSLLPGIARVKPVYRTDAGKDNFIKTEQRMIETFQIRSLPFLEMTPSTTWDWLAVAQHYGLKTRLLDWSQNALASLWFAVQKEPEKAPQTGERAGTALDARAYGAFWIMKPKDEHYSWHPLNQPQNDIYALNKTLIVTPKYLAKRIVAQRGFFTSHHFSVERNEYVALDDDPVFIPYLTKILIPPEIFYSIRYDLNRVGINALSIFPDLDGLCQEINWYYSWMKDERYLALGEKLPRVNVAAQASNQQATTAVSQPAHEPPGSL